MKEHEKMRVKTPKDIENAELFALSLIIGVLGTAAGIIIELVLWTQKQQLTKN